MTHFPRYLMHSNAVRITSRNQRTNHVTTTYYRSHRWIGRVAGGLVASVFLIAAAWVLKGAM